MIHVLVVQAKNSKVATVREQRLKKIERGV
jgi:hypothetical protein